MKQSQNKSSSELSRVYFYYVLYECIMINLVGFVTLFFQCELQGLESFLQERFPNTIGAMPQWILDTLLGHYWMQDDLNCQTANTHCLTYMIAGWLMIAGVLQAYINFDTQLLDGAVVPRSLKILCMHIFFLCDMYWIVLMIHYRDVIGWHQIVGSLFDIFIRLFFVTKPSRMFKNDEEEDEDAMMKKKALLRGSKYDDVGEDETKKVDVDDEDDGSSSDEAPEMVVQSDAKELERRRMEMEHMQRVRQEEIEAKRTAKREEKKRKRAEALSLDVLEALEEEDEDGEEDSVDEIVDVEPKTKKRENTIIRFERDGFTVEVDPSTGKTESQKMHMVNAALDSDATCSTAVDFMSRHFSNSRLRRGYNRKFHSMTSSQRKKRRRHKKKN
eukprot:g4660.t1